MRFVTRCKDFLLVVAVSATCALGIPATAFASGSADLSDTGAAATEGADPPVVDSPSWDFSGIKLSATRVTSGDPVTVTPKVSGDLDGATYNYVWSYKGGWDLWGSTVKDTGSGTTDATGTLTLTRAGSYTVYVDVTDRSGEKRTMSTTLEVASPEWEFTGVGLSASRVTSGQPVTVTPQVSGDLGGATYNYVWQRDGSWAEGEWGSTVLSSGRGTDEASSTLTLARAGAYTLYVDVTDRSGQRRTMSARLEVASPSWEFSGVEVSSPRVRVDEPVTVTPRVSGDLGGATYNYVWSYKGGWDLWGSTVRDGGEATPEATGTLSFYRPGRYVLYVDVTDRSGQRRTMSAGLVAYDDSWSLDGVDASPAEVVAGDDVTYAPMVSGDASGLRYNYVWQRDGSWARGDWGSTELCTGSDTAEASHTGPLGGPGRYTLYVDAVSARGERRTASAQAVAWGATGLGVSGSAASGWEASADLFEGHGVPGALYRLRWASADGSASGTLSDWSSNTSVSFSRSDLNSSASTYEIYLDVKYPNGKEWNFSTEVHKSGWYTSGGSWHYMYDSGSDATGWAYINGSWYYFSWSGVMQTGWLSQGGKSYYLDPSTGKMATGFAAGSYFAPDGAWLCSAGEASSAVNIARSVGSPTNYLLLVDNSACTTWVFKWVNGDWCATYKWVCSPGKASTPTVRGTYSIGSRGPSFGKGFTCYYWTQFYGNYLFHSVLYYPNSYSVMDGTLGVPASHGCVRLDINNARWINENIPSGTRVYSY